MSDTKKFDGREILQQLWNGEIPLFKTFWLYYFAIIVALSLLAGAFMAMAPFFNILKIVWAGFMVKPIWVAADKYAGDKIWAILSKICAILIGLAVLGSVLQSMTV